MKGTPKDKVKDKVKDRVLKHTVSFKVLCVLRTLLKIFKMKKKKETTLYFSELVSTYFQFFEKKFGLRPSFDGSSPRDLKLIVDAMRKRSEEKEVEWTIEIAKAMLEKFLEFCYLDNWLRDNFLLSNLNRQKDKIFIKIKSQINGTGTSKEGFTRDGVTAEFNRRYNQ